LSAHPVATWQTDPALASVRDPEALAKLPDTEREPWQRYWADVAAVVAADPVEQGRARAARRDSTQAADWYAQCLTHGPTDDGHFWFEYAALLLLSGDRPGYVKGCARLVDRCGKDKGPRSYHVARACTLAPLCRRGPVAAGPPGREVPPGLPRIVPLLDQSLKADATAGRAVLNRLWLALPNQRLGKAEEARRWLGKAQARLAQYGDGMPPRAEAEVGLHLHDWLEAHVLRREAEALIQAPG
jgi:hypothetical protein